MKKLAMFLIVLTTIYLSSCGYNLQPISNIYSSQTQVLLQNNEFKIIGKAKGEASATYILGIGGLSQKAIYNNAVADMFNNANLSGSQTITHINVHNHIGGVPPFYYKVKYVASGTIITFDKSYNNENSTNISLSAPIEQNIKPTMQTQVASKEKKYKIGDIYICNGQKGVVVSVSDDGKHGKIISLKRQIAAVWSKKNEYIHANNENYGKDNCKLITDHTIYPAISKCLEKGDGWYLPSLVEMQNIYQNIDVINKALQENGGVKIMLFEPYWTSTEKDENQAIATQSTY